MFIIAKEGNPEFRIALFLYHNQVGSLLELNDALSHHSLSYLQETSYVSTLYVVNVTIILCTILHTVSVNIVHDVVKLGINLLTRPLQAL